MAPFEMSDRYKRYKRGTKKSVQWLVEKGGGVHSKAQTTAGEVVKVPTVELKRLTGCIVAAASSTGLLPAGIESTITLLADVVAGRRECALWYKQNPELRARKQWKSDASHCYFTNALEDILRQLESICPQTPAPDAKAKKEKQVKRKGRTGLRSDLLGNFTCLSVEDVPSNTSYLDPIIDPFVSLQPTMKAETAPSPSVQYEAEDQDDDVFAIWCFFTDCSKIRAYTNDVWRAYMAGKLNYLVAVEITDKAFIMNHLLADALSADNPRLASFTDIVELLEIGVLADGKKLENPHQKMSGRVGKSASVSNCADILCIPAYVSLTLLRTLHQQQDGKSPEQVEEDFRNAETSDPFVCNILRAWEIEPAMRTHLDIWHKHGEGDLDTFNGDFIPYIDHTKPIPLFSVLDLQIYMDMFKIIARRPTNSIKTPNWVDGIETCNDDLSVLAVAHVYTVCRKLGLAKDRWMDLEFVIKTQGAEKLKLWQTNESTFSLASAAKRLDLALGEDVAKHARTRTRVPLPQHQQVMKRAVRLEPNTAYYTSQYDTWNDGNKTIDELFVRDALYRTADKVLKDDSIELDQGIREQWTKSRTLAPEQLLSVLQATLEKDDIEQMFDFRMLAERCRKVLTGFMLKFPDVVRKLRPSNGIDAECHGYQLASDALWQAARVHEAQPEHMSHTVLAMFGVAIQRNITEGRGSDLTTEAHTRAEMLRCEGTGSEKGSRP
ncbi:hypothetical protein LTR56_021035 [Elasticomyces elasticus]|nr:hypothetical protein LTR56_021035 [Elasticomyces elasticus]KAK3646931.1 hypothetical protein LTR22_014084 [Elasticomyces elasticus]KAK4909896.1 hypothetical protein LTR49_021381 [Elasticomyces elasticus]KAK5750351.1 hypothetical protein LTS12_019612 [Elasticomyces elasticus]